MDIKSAIKQNLQYQKKYRKKTYTKPLLFHLIEKFDSDLKHPAFDREVGNVSRTLVLQRLGGAPSN